MLVSRDWSGKTLAEHKADRATVVREALLSAGVVAPEIERMAADVKASDGLPRYVWTDSRPEPSAYTQVLLRSIVERQRWREQYREAVDTVSATGPTGYDAAEEECCNMGPKSRCRWRSRAMRSELLAQFRWICFRTSLRSMQWSALGRYCGRRNLMRLLCGVSSTPCEVLALSWLKYGPNPFPLPSPDSCDSGSEGGPSRVESVGRERSECP